jgi:hypothetical protein
MDHGQKVLMASLKRDLEGKHHDFDTDFPRFLGSYIAEPDKVLESAI